MDHQLQSIIFVRLRIEGTRQYSIDIVINMIIKGLLALASNLLRIRAFNAKTLKDVLMKSFGKQQVRAHYIHIVTDRSLASLWLVLGSALGSVSLHQVHSEVQYHCIIYQ